MSIKDMIIEVQTKRSAAGLGYGLYEIPDGLFDAMEKHLAKELGCTTEGLGYGAWPPGSFRFFGVTFRRGQPTVCPEPALIAMMMTRKEACEAYAKAADPQTYHPDNWIRYGQTIDALAAIGAITLAPEAPEYRDDDDFLDILLTEMKVDQVEKVRAKMKKHGFSVVREAATP